MKHEKFHPGEQVRYRGGGSWNVDKLVVGQIYTVEEGTNSDGKIILFEIEHEHGFDGWYFECENFVRVDAETIEAIDNFDRAMGVI